MCVILIADDERPSPEMIAKAYDHNDHGAGIAWREPAENDERDAEGNPIMEVVWEKGLELARLQELAAEAPLPFVIHCRIASCGGKLKQLTHPFPITKDVELYLSGRIRGQVLFHNGHWGSYRLEAKDAAKAFGERIPDGKLSDTRIMAWCAHLYGNNFVDLIDAKGVAFGPTDLQLFWGDGWTYEDGVWMSNTGFKTVTGVGFRGTVHNQNYNRVCKHPQCRSFNTDQDGYCPEHRTVPEIGGATRPTPAPNVSANSQPSATGTPTSTTEAAKAGSKQDGTGGSRPAGPFAAWAQAQLDFRLKRISKKQFKRARRAHEKFLQTQIPGRMAPPILVKNPGYTTPPGTH